MRFTRVLGIAAVVTAVAACSGGTSSELPYGTSDWNPIDGGMEALLTGELELRNGCLVVVDPGSDHAYGLVLPASLTEWDASSESLHYGGLIYRMGDTVYAGGGFTSNISAQFPEACGWLSTSDIFTVQDETLREPVD